MMTKEEIDLLFYEMLRDSGMRDIDARIYPFFVDHFGADIDKTKVLQTVL